jgi:PleD family two-component response regulator/EAL domain-containing protein (putative c-di-GMP-specific phosphodiesterase class I)
MNLTDESRLAEHRTIFLRQLPGRVDVIGRRLHRFLQSGWDINGLALIHLDAQRLGESSFQYGLESAGEHLMVMAELLGDTLQTETLPDPTLGERLWNLLENISAAVPVAPEPAQELTAPRLMGNSLRAETPPAGYWRRWGGDAPAPEIQAAPEPVIVAAAAAGEEYDPWGNEAPRYGRGVDTNVVAKAQADAAAPISASPLGAAVPAPAPAPATIEATPAPAEPAKAENVRLVVPENFRIYHLSGLDTISVELDQRLERQGIDVEILEDANELAELLGALPPNLVLVDAEFSAQLENIGELARQARARQKQRFLLVAMSGAEDISLRLSARRAGVDALIVGASNANDVLKRLQTLLEPGRDAPFRVLIVEDDRSQALFAEGILRNAGMESLVVLEALSVMPALEQFQPDLILMDLNMPGANGIELTALIREHEAFIDTPIVFLSGEADQDRQFDAIDAGGDDFLAKPIRPRHLISAVQNRVRRHRAMESRRGKQRSGGKDPTGLIDRTELLEQLAACLAAPVIDAPGGLLFLEIESLSLLRERMGLTALEQLLVDCSRLIREKLAETSVARFGDGSFLVLDTKLDDAGLEALAAQLRSALVQHQFQAQGHPLRLRISVGVCALRHGFADTGTMLNAVEKATREARTHERGVRRYEPPKSSEANREAALLAQVGGAIAQHSLELLYQPVVAVAGSDDSQFQVLLRMRDSSGKMHSAAEVIPAAERGDFIVNIDRWVLMQALALIRDRRSEGRPLRLFVTQSPLTLADSGQAEWLKAELAAHDVPGTSLVIELRLEDAAVHAATVRQFCDAMVSDGTQFCLSQYESGADADGLLEQLPLGFVKLARKYTAHSMSQAVRDDLKVLIDRAHRRGLEVIGHGVEDAQAAATLWMSGIDFIQGNLVQQADRELDFDFNQAVL